MPVIRDVDQKNIVQLSTELQQIAEKAKARKLSLDEMQGGSFTISNLGGIGGTLFHADRQRARSGDPRHVALGRWSRSGGTASSCRG